MEGASEGQEMKRHLLRSKSKSQRFSLNYAAWRTIESPTSRRHFGREFIKAYVYRQ
jgi:hypothetical protein